MSKARLCDSNQTYVVSAGCGSLAQLTLHTGRRGLTCSPKMSSLFPATLGTLAAGSWGRRGDVRVRGG